jgi:hypothetical protein
MVRATNNGDLIFHAERFSFLKLIKTHAKEGQLLIWSDNREERGCSNGLFAYHKLFQPLKSLNNKLKSGWLQE